MSKKKIALLLSGQPRSWQQGFDYIRKNLLDREDVDVFIHTWENSLIDYTKIRQAYKPLVMTVEKPLDPEPINLKYPRTAHPKYKAFQIWSSFYSIHQAAKMVPWRHFNMSDGGYDAYVRMRFDYALNAPINFDIIEKGKVYVPNCRMTPERDFCNDQFAFGTPKDITNYCYTFMYLNIAYDEGVVMNGEDMLAYNLQSFGLVGENMVYVNVHNPFPPGEYNGTWHSLIRADFNLWQ